jgi:uncharacterized Tic20 family protein
MYLLAGVVIVLVFIGPIAVWQSKKDKDGRNN